MTRFNRWQQTIVPDFWQIMFKPKELLKVTAHANSVLSLEEDTRLLHQYDLQEINEHLVGRMYTWKKLTIEATTYKGRTEKYPYWTPIDENWLHIDALYDKLVEPDLKMQVDLDFIVEDGYLKSSRALKAQTLYISKGRYAQYDIYGEIGQFLNYKRRDSVWYRDTIAPILAAFFLGPTYINLKAVITVMCGFPVAKYGNETVLSVKNGTVKTDKYTYFTTASRISVKTGDVLYRFQPICDVAILFTNKTHPKWWEAKPVDLFAKYRTDGKLTVATRNYLLSTFLYDAVASVQVNLDWQELQEFTANADILQLFYEALPIRTDITFTQARYNYSWDTGIMTPNKDSGGVRLGVNSRYGKSPYSAATDFFIEDSKIPRPQFFDDDNKETIFIVGRRRFHLLDDGDNFREFWSQDFKTLPYVEPYISNVYCRFTLNPKYDHREFKLVSRNIPTISDIQVLFRSGQGFYSEIPKGLATQEPSYIAVTGNNVYGVLEMADWTLNDLTITRDGLTVLDEVQGDAITLPVYMGNLPKNLTVTIDATLPKGTLIDIQYSKDKAVWTAMPEMLRNQTGNIYLKVRIFATELEAPVLKRLYASITI